MNAEVVFQHGFAFDAHVWDTIANALEQAGCRVILGERGYFGQKEAAPRFSSGQTHKKIAVAHSFGLHLLPDQTVAEADHVIAFSSFLHFHPLEPARNRFSRRIIRALLERLKTAPHAAVESFYKDCAIDPTSPPQAMDVEKLARDLSLLNDSFFNGKKIATKNLTALHGELDQVVSPNLGANLAAASQFSSFKLIAGAGHALPLTNARECLDALLAVCATFTTGNTYVCSTNHR